jgi:SPP1 family predicted phage head-tail adaptor
MPWPQIDPGKMVHRVTFLGQQKATDASGTVMDWVPVLENVWAQIEPVKGIDMLKAGQDVTQLYLTVRVYWQTGILPNMRVLTHKGTYIIQAIENPGERNVILVLTCLALGLNQ